VLSRLNYTSCVCISTEQNIISAVKLTLSTVMLRLMQTVMWNLHSHCSVCTECFGSGSSCWFMLLPRLYWLPAFLTVIKIRVLYCTFFASVRFQNRFWCKAHLNCLWFHNFKSSFPKYWCWWTQYTPVLRWHCIFNTSVDTFPPTTFCLMLYLSSCIHFSLTEICDRHASGFWHKCSLISLVAHFEPL
jgi:hypothetical protein